MRIFPWDLGLLQGAGIVILVACVTSAGAATPCSEEARRRGWRPPEVTTRAGVVLDFASLVDGLAETRLVFVGESHDRLEHHLNQLEIICRLHARNENWAVGLEFFQWPSQIHLDDFVAGNIDEPTMLRETEYFERWGYDYRLYQPIMNFAREHGISLVALNVPAEISKRVGRGGVAGLSEGERASLPAGLDRVDEDYRQRIEAIFEEHPQSAQGDLENFIQVQLLWDEGMAERAAEYLAEGNERRMIVLAGSGHALRSGIPERVARRLSATAAIVLQGAYGDAHFEEGDFRLVSDRVDLPEVGLLGVMLETEDGRVSVAAFGENSAAKSAGIEKGDRILRLDGAAVRGLADIKLSLLHKRPGDKVTVVVAPAGGDPSSTPRHVDVVLR